MCVCVWLCLCRGRSMCQCMRLSVCEWMCLWVHYICVFLCEYVWTFPYMCNCMNESVCACEYKCEWVSMYMYLTGKVSTPALARWFCLMPFSSCGHLHLVPCNHVLFSQHHTFICWPHWPSLFHSVVHRRGLPLYPPSGLCLHRWHCNSVWSEETPRRKTGIGGKVSKWAVNTDRTSQRWSILEIQLPHSGELLDWQWN